MTIKTSKQEHLKKIVQKYSNSESQNRKVSKENNGVEKAKRTDSSSISCGEQLNVKKSVIDSAKKKIFEIWEKSKSEPLKYFFTPFESSQNFLQQNENDSNRKTRLKNGLNISTEGNSNKAGFVTLDCVEKNFKCKRKLRKKNKSDEQKTSLNNFKHGSAVNLKIKMSYPSIRKTATKKRKSKTNNNLIKGDAKVNKSNNESQNTIGNKKKIDTSKTEKKIKKFQEVPNNQKNLNENTGVDNFVNPREFFESYLDIIKARQSDTPTEDDISKIDNNYLRTIVQIASGSIKRKSQPSELEHSQNIRKPTEKYRIQVANEALNKNKFKLFESDENSDKEEENYYLNIGRAKKKLPPNESRLLITDENTTNLIFENSLSKDKMSVEEGKNLNAAKPPNRFSNKIQMAHVQSEKLLNKVNQNKKHRNNTLKAKEKVLINEEESINVSKSNVRELWRRMQSENSLSSKSSCTVNDETFETNEYLGMKSYKILKRIVEEEVQRIFTGHKGKKIEEISASAEKPVLAKEEKNNKKIRDEPKRNSEPKNGGSSGRFHKITIAENQISSPVVHEDKKTQRWKQRKEQKHQFFLPVPMDNKFESGDFDEKVTNPKDTETITKMPEVIKNWSIMNRLEKAFLALGTPSFSKKNFNNKKNGNDESENFAQKNLNNRGNEIHEINRQERNQIFTALSLLESKEPQQSRLMQESEDNQGNFKVTKQNIKYLAHYDLLRHSKPSNIEGESDGAANERKMKDMSIFSNDINFNKNNNDSRELKGSEKIKAYESAVASRKTEENSNVCDTKKETPINHSKQVSALEERITRKLEKDKSICIEAKSLNRGDVIKLKCKGTILSATPLKAPALKEDDTDKTVSLFRKQTFEIIPKMETVKKRSFTNNSVVSAKKARTGSAKPATIHLKAVIDQNAYPNYQSNRGNEEKPKPKSRKSRETARPRINFRESKNTGEVHQSEEQSKVCARQSNKEGPMKRESAARNSVPKKNRKDTLCNIEPVDSLSLVSNYTYKFNPDSISTTTYKVSENDNMDTVPISPTPVSFNSSTSEYSTLTFDISDTKGGTEKFSSKRGTEWERNVHEYREIVADIIGQYNRTNDYLKREQNLRFARPIHDEAADQRRSSENLWSHNIEDYRRKIMQEYEAVPIFEYKSKFDDKRNPFTDRTLQVATNLEGDSDVDVKDYRPNVQKILNSQVYVDKLSLVKRLRENGKTAMEKVISLENTPATSQRPSTTQVLPKSLSGLDNFLNQYIDNMSKGPVELFAARSLASSAECGLNV